MTTDDADSLWTRLRVFFFGRTSAPLAKQPPPPFEDRYGYLAVVGEPQYQSALKRVAKTTGRLAWAVLVPEPENPFDRNAVTVQINAETIGYLCRAEARRYHRRLSALVPPMEVPAELIGGERRKPSFGVLLDCRDVEQLPDPTRDAKAETSTYRSERSTVRSGRDFAIRREAPRRVRGPKQPLLKKTPTIELESLQHAEAI